MTDEPQTAIEILQAQYRQEQSNEVVITQQLAQIETQQQQFTQQKEVVIGRLNATRGAIFALKKALDGLESSDEDEDQPELKAVEGQKG